jgi:D-alanyl-D-alanine dipeptidase
MDQERHFCILHSLVSMNLFKTAVIILLSFQVNLSFSQQKPTQKSGSFPTMEQKMIDQGLVDVHKKDADILVDLKYSSTDNFLKKDVYGDLNNAYLQPEMAAKLFLASKYLRTAWPGYQLLVYDAARPNSAQYALWDALDEIKIPKSKKTMYVADPAIGSNHNFGCAVDLTVVDKNGKPLDMGTPYDFFGPLAYPRMEQEMLKSGKLTDKQIANRKILRTAMVKAGFTVNTTEWWHFDGMSKKQARARYGMIK